MLHKKMVTMMILSLILVSACAKRLAVEYGDVEPTNFINLRLVSGEKTSGTVEKVEPHQLTLIQKNLTVRVISKPAIDEIKRKPPEYDDFGNGISELEIRAVKKNSNALVYGIGGGLLSFSTSFFIGSLAGKNSIPVLAGTTAGGGLLGTVLFASAGKTRDRKHAIEKIRDERRLTQIKLDEEKADTGEGIEKMLEDEKQKQKALREEREKLLKELEKKKK
jgi:hypothetical protein